MPDRVTLTRLLPALAAGIILAGTPASAAAQGNPLQKLKRAASEAAKKAKEGAKSVADSVAGSMAQQADSAVQGAAPATAAAGGAGTSQPGTPAASQPTTSTSSGGGAAPATGKSAARVQQEVLLTASSPGTSYYVSPRNQHVAAIIGRGSRFVVAYDGVDGPKFDEIMGGNTGIAFSPDGNRYAYLGRIAREWIYMVDGKELLRLPITDADASAPFAEARLPAFDPSSKRVYFVDRRNVTLGNESAQLYLDGKPGPLARNAPGDPVFSSDGARHAYLIEPPGHVSNTPFTLVVDGKPAGYVGGNPQFTGDGKLFTQRTIPAGGGEELLLEGKLFMRSPPAGGLVAHMAPVGSLVIVEVQVGLNATVPSSYLTVGEKRVAGSECRAVGVRVYFTPDAKHWAAVCPSKSGSWVMADGKKGREYPNILGEVRFTSGGLPVYHASTVNASFAVVGDEESDGTQWLGSGSTMVKSGSDMFPMEIVGNHVGYVAGSPNVGLARQVIVDGKATQAEAPDELALLGDGSHFSFMAGKVTRRLYLDGKEWSGLAAASHPNGSGESYRMSYSASPDGRHIAFSAFRDADNTTPGIAIDGKFFATPGYSDARLLTFSPDGRHLAWIATRSSRMAIFLDGEIVADLPFTSIEQQWRTNWAMTADGLVFIAQDGNAIKRFRVAPSEKTSVETMLAKAH